MVRPRPEQDASFSQVVQKLRTIIDQDGAIFVCGNGGSALDAQHVVTDLSYIRDPSSSPKSFALVANISNVTSISNDVHFTQVFARQIRVLCDSNDALICISTSGESENVINAAKAAREIGVVVVAFTGARRSNLVEVSDLSVQSRFSDTARVQEEHRIMYHYLCASLGRQGLESE